MSPDSGPLFMDIVTMDTAAVYVTSHVAYTAANHAMAIHSHVLVRFYIGGYESSLGYVAW